MYTVISVSNKRYMPLHSQDNREKNNFVPSNNMKRETFNPKKHKLQRCPQGKPQTIGIVTQNWRKAKSNTLKGNEDFIVREIINQFGRGERSKIIDTRETLSTPQNCMLHSFLLLSRNGEVQDINICKGIIASIQSDFSYF